MRKSRARIALESALAAAKPAAKADLAVRLTNLIEKESRTKARNKRMQNQKPAAPPAPVDDSAEPFEMEWPPAPAPLTHLPEPTPAVASAPEPKPADAKPAPRALPENG